MRVRSASGSLERILRGKNPPTMRERNALSFVQKLLDRLMQGTTAVLKNPFLLVGLMLVSLLVKRLAASDKEGNER